jgi:hypothetical protein
MSGMSVGDAGAHVVNNIPIPNTQAINQASQLTVPANSSNYFTQINGSGFILLALWSVTPAAGTNLYPSLVVDGSELCPFSSGSYASLATICTIFAGISGGFSAVSNASFDDLSFTLRIPFKQSVKIGASNNSAGPLALLMAIVVELIS